MGHPPWGGRACFWLVPSVGLYTQFRTNEAIIFRGRQLMTIFTALSLLGAVYAVLGALLVLRGHLRFMIDLDIAMVKENPSVPRWKITLYANVLRLVAVVGWPLFIGRG